MVNYLKQQWKIGQKKKILDAHLPEARKLFAELKLHKNKDYARIVGPDKERIAEYLERHYIEGAARAFDLTQSLKISLLYLYHGLEGRDINRLELPAPIKGLEEPVKDMLRNYYEIKALDNMLYTAEEVSRYYSCAIVHKDQYAARFLDELNKLQLMDCMDLNLNRKFLAEKVRAHAYLMKRLGFHAASSEAFNTSFEVLAPRACNSVKKMFYGENIESGRLQIERIMRGLQRMLNDLMKRLGIEGIVEVRVKTPYSIYKKIVERWRVQLRTGLANLAAMPDLVALRVILTGKDNNKKSVYKMLDAIEKTPKFFKYADPADIMAGGKRVQVKKDYIKNPPMDPPRPYQSIHMIGNFAALAAYFRNEYGHRLYDEKVKLTLRNVEFQLRTEKMHMKNEFGHGAAGHGNYKTKGMPTVAQQIALTISDIHKNVRINKDVKIIVMERIGSTDVVRFDPPEYEVLHNKLHLESKIMRAVRNVYGKVEMGELRIEESIMDKIVKAEKYDVIVYIARDPVSGKISILDIL